VAVLLRLPDTGSLLVFHPPDQNVCPDSCQVFKGYSYDHVVCMLRADALKKGALAAALAYRLTEDHADAEEGALILKLCAAFGAHAYSQTLGKSIWLIDLAWPYDLLRDIDVFTPADRAHIECDLLYAAAMTVNRANMGPTDNIQWWILGAEATVGCTLDNRTLIDQAIDVSPLMLR
jgi:hypothetical protein